MRSPTGQCAKCDQIPLQRSGCEEDGQPATRDEDAIGSLNERWRILFAFRQDAAEAEREGTRDDRHGLGTVDPSVRDSNRQRR